MPRYAITEQAGRFVAGQTNTGVGTVLTLTAKQAAHDLRLGSLRALDAGDAAPDASPLSDMTVKELRALAEDRGVEIDHDARKADLVAALAAGQAGD
ncbi:MAG: Rho termination factor N-terminal domain-containing protein [Paracoccaceae bacterium]